MFKSLAFIFNLRVVSFDIHIDLKGINNIKAMAARKGRFHKALMGIKVGVSSHHKNFHILFALSVSELLSIGFRPLLRIKNTLIGFATRAPTQFLDFRGQALKSFEYKISLPENFYFFVNGVLRLKRKE